MRKFVFLASLGIMAGCTPAAPPVAAPAVAAPVSVGKVPNQPGSCFFKDPAGKVFISACPAA
jgi:hypothetical protein